MQGGRPAAVAVAILALLLQGLALPGAQAQVGTPPIADFTFSPQSPVAGQDVHFHDTSINGSKKIHEYEWTSTAGHRVYKRVSPLSADSYQRMPPDAYINFSAAGTYEVTLTVKDLGGNVESKTRSITVRPGLSPHFTLVREGPEVRVDASASTSPYGAIASYTWVWGDGGANSTGVRATHRYAAAGAYVVRLLLVDAQGNPGRTHKDVALEGVNGTVAFTMTPEVPLVGAPVTFADSSVPGTFSAIARREWILDGEVVGSDARLVRTFDAPGHHNLTLAVFETDGSNRSVTRAFRVAAPPVAEFALAQEGRTVTLDASASTDPDGRVVSYAWDFGDGRRASGPRIEHTFRAAGSYVVKLTVTDDEGASATVNRTVAVEGRPVTVAFDVSPTPLRPGEPVTFTDASSDPEGSLSAWSWELGDGATAEGSTAVHVYAAPGTYEVNLTVTDSQGGLARASRTVTVVAPPPPATTTPSTRPATTPATPSTPATTTGGTPPATTTGEPAVTLTPARVTGAAPGDNESPALALAGWLVAAAAAGLVLRRRRA